MNVDDVLTVLVAGAIAEEGIALLEAGGDGEAQGYGGGLRVEVLAADRGLDGAALRACDGLIVAPGVAVGADDLEQAGRLRVIGCAGADLSAVDVAAATRHGILVVHAPEAGLTSEVEHVLALLLVVARDVAGADAALRRGDAGPIAVEGVELQGKTLGLIGTRASTPALAERARALGMNVLACQADSPGPAGVVECVAGERVVAEADFVVLQTESDAPRFGVAELAELKRGARLVSPFQAGAVELEVLAGALSDGRLAGAAVVVEPGAAPSLAALAAPGLLFTSPAGAGSVDACRRAAVSAAEQVAAVLRGRLLRGAVNVPAAGADDGDELLSQLELCDLLGRLLVGLADEPVRDVEITYGGSIAYFDTRLLTQAVLGGLVAGRAAGPVNFVNAELVAAELGVTANEARESRVPDFPRLITVAAEATAVAAAGDDPAPPAGATAAALSVSGTWLGPERKPRLVRVFGEDVDLTPAEHMAFLRYVDAPGIGGKVGTLLGEWGVNIGHMSVGRGKLGRESVMALTLDEALSEAQTRELLETCGLSYARAVEL